MVQSCSWVAYNQKGIRKQDMADHSWHTIPTCQVFFFPLSLSVWSSALLEWLYSHQWQDADQSVFQEAAAKTLLQLLKLNPGSMLGAHKKRDMSAIKGKALNSEPFDFEEKEQ